MPAQVALRVESEAAAERFVREYVLSAIERAPTIDDCDGISFGLNEAPNPDGGSVHVVVLGDPEPFLVNEEPKWERLREDGLIQDWEVSRLLEGEFESTYGERGAVLTRQLMPLADRMAALVYEEFDDLDDLPDASDAAPDEETDMGWWAVPHHIAFGSLDYSAEEEIEMHRAGIEEDLKLLAESDGEEAVDAQLDALIADLEAMRDEVKAGRTRFQG